MAIATGYVSQAQQHYNSARTSMQMFNERLGQSALGRAARRGVFESFGWHYDGHGPFWGIFAEQQNLGFMGLRDTRAGLLYNRLRASGAGRAGAGIATTRSLMRQSGRIGAWGTTKAVGKAAFNTLPAFFTAYSAYQGYQEGGIWGATKGVAGSVATNVASSVAMRAIGLAATPLAVAGLAVGGAIGAYDLGEAGIARARSLRRLEMGAEVHDMFGTVSTMRQRSIAALQNTHVNGRLALGNEASLMHTPMMR